MAGSSKARTRRDEHLGRTVLADLRQADVPRTLWRDLGSIRRFYLTEERRSQLSRMGFVRRHVWQVLWILQAMLLRLSPARRILTLLSLALFAMGPTSIPFGYWNFDVNLHFWGFLALFLVLMLELKDELLARDEIEVAREVQLGLLPREAPSLPGWEIWLYTRPANHVGGDVVDAFRLPDDRLALTLGDVAGKGLGAALLASKLQATVRALAPASDGVDDLAVNVNEIMVRDGITNRFATMVHLELDAGSGVVELVNAGHCHPQLLRADRVESYGRGGLPLGIMSGETYEEGTLSVEPGECLVVYSDGLTEARRIDDQMYGEGQFAHVLPHLRNRSAEDVGRALVQSVDTFVGGAPLDDDLSLIVLRRIPLPPLPPPPA